MADARARLAAREEALRAAEREVDRSRMAAAAAAAQVKQMVASRQRLSEEQQQLGARLDELRAQLPTVQDAVADARSRVERETADLAAASARGAEAGARSRTGIAEGRGGGP